MIIFMKNKFYMSLFCTLSFFELSYVEASSKKPINKNIKTKDQPMEQAQILDLKNFKQSPTGFSYEIIKTGKGVQPQPGQTVTVHYTGHLLEGKDTVGKFFDSSKKRNQPFRFTLGRGQVIKGWDQALSMMHVGDIWLVSLPPHLGYGSQNVGGGLIPANSTLLFEIELLAVS